jgi:acetylornithine deacetylase
LADLVGFDTISSNSNLALIRYVEALLGRRGIAAEVLMDGTGEKANLFAMIGPSRPEGVVLSGHTDVVPVADQPWTTDPFRLTRRDDRLYGRGTADMKSFIACTLAALERAELDSFQRPIYLAFSYDEEIGCLGAPWLIERAASQVAQPAVVVVGEPSRMRVIGSHKSMHLHKVGVTGVAAHSSAVHQGISANALAVRLMNVLMRIADGLAAGAEQDTAFEPPFTTLTIGTMQGGTAANILATEAGFVFDLRCLPGQSPEEILRPFFAEVDVVRRTYPAASITVEPGASVPPLAARIGGAAERLARAASGDNGGMLTVSYGAEAGQFQEAGFETVICGPGSMDQGHQADEFIEISEIEKCIQFMDRLFSIMRQPVAAAL